MIHKTTIPLVVFVYIQCIYIVITKCVFIKVTICDLCISVYTTCNEGVIIILEAPHNMKYEQMDLFYEKPSGHYKYWYRIYRYHYDTCPRCTRCLP